MITEGHLARHYQGRRGGRGPAIIDIAQDYLLYHLAREGMFELGISLKGGTAIRKFWAGNSGRFSIDLDFAGVDDSTAALLVDAIEGAHVNEFTFGVESIDGTRRMRLLITSVFGEPDVPARLDFGRRILWLAPQLTQPIAMPIHERYQFALLAIPISAIEETIAEKLARFRRGSLVRDLYDLAWFATRPFDEALVRRLVVLKVWGDVVEDGLGGSPYDPEDILRPRAAGEFRPEAIGYLTGSVDIPGWIHAVQRRYAFLRDRDEEEQRLSRCSRGDAWDVSRHIASFAQ